MVAGLVGGIQANSQRQADFLYQNALMILYTLESLKQHSPKTKILYTGSTCIYPKENPQPINESRFMMGPLEETNKGYAIAKGMGADPHAVLMAIGVAASCAFGTPVGTPPNTLVLGPGQYKFIDYVKAGVPLIIVCFIVSILIIPMVWPFFPGK